MPETGTCGCGRKLPHPGRCSARRAAETPREPRPATAGERRGRAEEALIRELRPLERAIKSLRERREELDRRIAAAEVEAVPVRAALLALRKGRPLTDEDMAEPDHAPRPPKPTAAAQAEPVHPWDDRVREVLAALHAEGKHLVSLTTLLEAARKRIAYTEGSGHLSRVLRRLADDGKVRSPATGSWQVAA